MAAWPEPARPRSVATALPGPSAETAPRLTIPPRESAASRRDGGFGLVPERHRRPEAITVPRRPRPADEKQNRADPSQARRTNLSMNFPNPTPFTGGLPRNTSNSQRSRTKAAGFPTGIPIYVDPQRPAGQAGIPTMASTITRQPRRHPAADDRSTAWLLRQLGLDLSPGRRRSAPDLRHPFHRSGRARWPRAGQPGGGPAKIAPAAGPWVAAAKAVGADPDHPAEQ